MHYSTRLRWIKPGLDDELGGLRQTFSEMAETALEGEHLEGVRRSLARLRRVLELVAVYGGALLAEEMEALAQALARGQVEQRDDGLRLLFQGVLQLPHYLERVQRSGQDVPVLLMPILNDIRALLRRRLLSESSLFSPDLSTTVPDLAPSALAQGAITTDGVRAYARRLRPYYQRGLVAWYRGDEETGLATVAAVLRYLERLSGDSRLGPLWWVAAGLVAILRDGSLPGGVSVKLLLGQLDLQIRALAEVGGDHLDRQPPPELMKNLLFYIGRFHSGQHRARRIVAVYRLDDLLPEEDADGFLGPGLEVLDAVNEALFQDLSRVKDMMDIYVRAEHPVVEDLRPATGLLARVADTLALLGLGGARQTVLEQADRLARALDGGTAPDQDLLLAIAGDLLEVDSALAVLASLGLDQAIAGEPDAAQVRALKDHAQQQVLAAALGEVRVELAAVREDAEAYLAGSGDASRLDAVRTRLGRVAGGLALVGLEPLAELMAECDRYVRERLQGNAPRLPARESLDAFAEAVMGADYFLEGYLEGRLDTGEILAGIQASVAALELPPDVDVDEELDFADNNEELELAPPPPEQAAEDLAAPEVEEDDDLAGDTQEITLAAGPGEAWVDEGSSADTPGDEDAVPAPIPPHLAAGLADASDRLRRLDEGAGDGGEAAATEAPDPEIVRIFIVEAGETLAAMGEQLEAWRAEPQRQEPLGVIRRGFHTLKGSGRLVGAWDVGELAWATERVLNRLLEGTLDFRPAVAELVVDVHGHMPELVAAFEHGRATPAAWEALMRRAQALADGPPPGQGDGGPGPEGGEPQDSSGDGPPPAPAGPAGDGPQAAVDPGMLKVFLPEADGVLAQLREACARLGFAGGGPVPEDLVRCCHTLKGITRVAGLPGQPELFGALEAGFEAHRQSQRSVAIDACALLQEGIDGMGAALDALRGGGRPVAPAPELAARAQVWADAAAEQPAPAVQAAGEDALAAELREVFVEEAQEIQHACDGLLERWQGDAVEQEVLAELQRLLHTLKGGARMAELTPLVSLSHALETLLTRLAEGRAGASGANRDVVQRGLDGIAAMLDQVRGGRPPADGAPLAAAIEDAAAGREPAPPAAEGDAGVREPEAAYEPAPVVTLVTDHAPGRAERDGGSAATEKVGVAIELLDHLVSTAGEISISRSRVEQQVSELGQAIKEMDQTVARLRSQLHRLELETDARTAFRREGDGEGEFDPLELDRYGEVHELTRGMAESVADLTSVQDQLTQLVKGSEGFLLQQARLSSDLQERLLTTRMVPFARYLPRLRRLARQTAEELGKQVEMHVTGHDEELDHSLIGPVVGALEHMVSNAVDHGIELPEERQRQGKPAVGTIHLDLARDHNDVVVRLRDDGAGMDLEAIRRHAVARGLLDGEAAVADDELVQLVFEQAFSTATAVTRISGRGVGLDVVNAAINQLGGSLDVATRAGAGTTFTVRLPTTISVSQALMVQVDEEQFGLPLSHLEGVMRLSRQEAEAMAGEGTPHLEYLGEEYRVYRLGRVLGMDDGPGAVQRRFPVLFVRVGERRTAFVVDAIGGRQEIVVKPVGPQLGGIAWILGATVLGDGGVVLVIDLPALVRLAVSQPAHPAAAGETRKAPRPPLVMVVDDSLTVRRVAERFLERNGMDVLTARDGVEALALLQDHAPDLMLLDIEMPRMDGYELATSIRNDERLGHLPIIMITSRGGHKHSARARAIGVDEFMSKPYQEQELLARINDLTRAGHG